MHSTTVYLTDKQKTFFKKRYNTTKIPIAVQMREAFDVYIKEHNKE